MQNELEAPVAGTVVSLLAKQGSNLDNGQPILEIEPAGAPESA
jgi:biotin carboxyl carrier protein